MRLRFSGIQGENMEKKIKVGDVEKIFRSNGATPIKYRRLFKGRDFFRDLSGMKGLDANALADADIEAVERIAFVMCEDSNSPDVTFEAWLEQFDLFDLFQAMPGVIGCITGNLDTQNISNDSKNGEPAES